MQKRIKLEIFGTVQGVGFRPFIFNLAKLLNLTGFIFNHSKGVTIEVQGTGETLDKFNKLIINKAPKAAVIEEVDSKQLKVNRKESNFLIKKSKSTKGSQSISSDLAICEDCKKELFDKNNRRFLHPFINCTNCGPRFTIIKNIPYDRKNTSMAEFKMCQKCKEEYDDPMDRRFYAQPISCPNCGPAVQGKTTNNKQQITNNKTFKGNDAIKEAANIIKKGGIVVIKGLGGFHLACDANSKKAVDKIRKKKNRPQKPFALMMDSISTIQKYCLVSKEEEKVLKSSKSPIVLLKAKKFNLLNDIAPGLNKLGVMLPYTPLHLLLFYYLKKSKPLIMTSGNVSGEPIITDNKEALEKLSGIADYFLLYNREILSGYDDSIVSLIGKRNDMQIIRSGRGVSPITLDLSVKPNRDLLAFGTDFKNTFCLLKDNKAIVSQYLGDLENLSNIKRFKKILDNYKKLFRVKPEILASDLHPCYFSTKLAEDLSKDPKSLFKIQHHHAHVASVYAENRLRGKVIGVAFDGTGLSDGEDNKIWGGEFFYGNPPNFKRIAHLEYIKLPGGDLAAKDPWRVAASMLKDIGRINELANVLPIDQKKLNIISMQLGANINSMESSSMGRLFDAVSSILNIAQENTYEGEAAMKLESIINKIERKYYKYSFRRGKHFIINWHPVIEQIIHDIKKGISKSVISAKFHHGTAKMILEVCRYLTKHYSAANSVCLSGGVFQNSYLLERTMIELEKAGFKIFINKKVPTNDSGVSLGQAIIAALRVK